MRKILLFLLVLSSYSVTFAMHIATGGNHNLVIKADGSLWAWGSNSYGQLGNGELGDEKYLFSPIKIMDGVVQVAAGSEHTLVIKTDGSLWVWGYNNYGQIGNGESSWVDFQTVPIKIMDDVVQMAAGSNHTLAIKTDGSLWGWGYNNYGQIGNGESSWVDFQTVPVKIMDDVIQVAAGANHTLAIKTDGSLWAWGYNLYGQLGNGESGSEKKQISPVKIMDGVVQVTAGDNHTLAIKTDGSLWGWGYNNYGQIGNGESSWVDFQTVPVKIMDDVVQVAAGRDHSVAISSDNTLYGWGINDYAGHLVGGISYATLSPKSIFIGIRVIEVDAHSNNTIFLTSNDDVFAFGDNTFGQLGSDNTDSNVPVKVPIDNIMDIAAGGNTSFAINSSNSLFGWGFDAEAEIGDVDRKSKTAPVEVDGAFTQIAIGAGSNSVALKKDNTLWEWGVDCSDPSYVNTVPIKTQTGYIQISAGYKRIFGIKEDHSLWAWGDNSYGCVGTGTTDFQKDPVKIMEDVIQVSAGTNHTLAIKTDGSFWAWGDNYEGQLGNGQSGGGKNKYSPVKIMEGVSQAATGTNYSLALKTDGSLWFWGNDEWILPEKIMDDVNQIAGGDKHFFAIKTDGSLWAWGDNYYGQLGNGESGSEKRQYPPIKILDSVTKVAAGTNHTLAIKSDGSLWAWGSNSHGQLGQGTKNYSETPVFVMNISIAPETIIEYAVDGVTYLLRPDETAQIKTITANRVDLEIPSTITYESINYDIIAIGDSIFKGLSTYANFSVIFPSNITKISANAFCGGVPSAIVWKGYTKIPASSFDNSLISRENFLLYVNSAEIAPSGINNLVVNGIADEIVLKDGHVFDCPQEFVAKKISYIHNYSMETGYNECAGWETIALPFDVGTITHSSKGELTPMAMATLDSDKKPFWLYVLSDQGFVAASRILADTPYLISMPNNPHYSSYYNLSGSVTFSSTNATVKKTTSQISNYNGALFETNYSFRSLSEHDYAININNDLITYTGLEKPGSIFISNLREIKPFECYFWKDSSNTRSIDIVFADGDSPTGIIDYIQEEGRDDKQVRIYNLSGQLVDVINGNISSNSNKKFPAGVYIVNGKKVIIQPEKDIIFPK